MKTCPRHILHGIHSETPRHGTGSANATWELAGDTPEPGRRTQQGEPPARFNPGCCQIPMSVFQAEGNKMQRSKFYVEWWPQLIPLCIRIRKALGSGAHVNRLLETRAL